MKNINENSNGSEEFIRKERSLKQITSYSTAYGIDKFAGMAFAANLIFFYEVELGFSVWLYALAFVIYTIWNMFNDPLMGYLTDRNTRMTKKLGRHFPWIIFGLTLYLIFGILLYMPPHGNEWIIFIWLVIFLCITDTLFSLYDVNYSGLAPTMFRTENERRKHGAISTVLGTLGLLMGTILPPLLLVQGNINSYLIMAITISIISFCFIIFMVPGVHENKELINLYFQDKAMEEQINKEGFFKTMKIALKQKNFVVYFLVYFLFQITAALALQSLRYFAVFVMGSADYQVFLGLAMFGGIFLGIPIWAKLSKKLGFRKVFLVGSVAMGVLMLPMLFVTELIPVMITMIGLGIGIAAFWVMLTPIFCDTMDEVALNTGKRKEGVYFGIRTFFARLVLIVVAVTFAVVHTLTGFNTDPYSAQAIWGIRIHTALIGLVAVFIAALLLWKFYDLTPEKMSTIKAKLEEREL